MSPQRALVAVVIAACVADCAGQREQIANYAQNKMIGLTKEQVLACMGTPASKATEGATEVWSYPSESRLCTVNVTMMDGRVNRMNYVGPTGDLLSQNEQDDVQNLSQCAGRPAMSNRCKSDTMKE